MSKEKQNYQDKLVELIEEETYLATGVKTKEHWSGDCNMNKILKLVEQEIEKARQEERERITKKIKKRLDYCQQQNGLPYCKNCGLSKEDLIKL
jgi:hypothetical protein